MPAPPAPEPRSGWRNRLKTGLRKTGTSIQAAFVNAKIDEDLYEELESALLMADAGVKATEFLLDDLRRRVKASMATDAAQVKVLLAEAIADLLKPLEKPLLKPLLRPSAPSQKPAVIPRARTSHDLSVHRGKKGEDREVNRPYHSHVGCNVCLH